MHYSKPLLALALLFGSAVQISFAADTGQSVSNANSEQAADVHYEVFEYTDNEALIKTIRHLNKLGFNTDIPADGLNLSAYRGGVITSSSEPGAKALSYEDALAAFHKFMKPSKLSSTDVIDIKITPMSVKDFGSVLKQDYKLLVKGENIKATRHLLLPQGSLAMTVVKFGDGKLLVITTTP